MRITLVHALKHSIVPIEASFGRLWPDARLMNLLDDSLSADLARDGGLTDAMTERFLRLGRYAAGTGSDAILFTCSAFGPCFRLPSSSCLSWRTAPWRRSIAATVRRMIVWSSKLQKICAIAI